MNNLTKIMPIIFGFLIFDIIRLFCMASLLAESFNFGVID